MSNNESNEAEELIPPVNEKENVDSQKDSKIPNRRDSLGRGILKNLKPLGQNTTLNLTQLPLRSAPSKDSSFSGKKSYRRRVSFAPEVTLHKIDLIQAIPQPEERPPRRRETIAVTPYTSRSASPEKPASNFVDNAEEIMYDSSDVEMEDDSHVYSSPQKSQLGFKIHEQKDKDEYTETIDMSISRDNIRVVDDEEENTMELTRPLGEIKLDDLLLKPSQENVLDQSTQNSQEQQSQSTQSTQSSASSIGSQSAFGSIVSLFDDDEEEDDLEHGSIEMDLTQPFNKSAEFPVNKQSFISVQEESLSDVDITTNEDQTMDITSLADGATDRITMQNTILNKQIIDKQDISMDQTQIYGNINSDDKDSNVTEDLTQPMQENTIYGESFVTHDKDNLTPTRSESFQQPRKLSLPGTPLKSVRSHTSETGSPHSSKRKHLPESELLANNLRERINSLTPRKKRKSLIQIEKTGESTKIPESITTEAQLQNRSQENHQGPSTIPQDNHKVSFTPLRSKRASLISGGKIEIGKFTDTIPLAPSHEHDIIEEQEYQPVTLQKFLNDLSVEFFDDLNVNEDFTVDLKPVKKGESVDPIEFLISKNSKLPWIELYNFSCEELQNNMNQLKKLFDDLSDEFSEENPTLVREYYETSGLIQQKKMNDRLLQMKTYSDKEAESAWYSWRYKLLEELAARLYANSSSLNEDNDKLMKLSNEINVMQSLLVNKQKDLHKRVDEAQIKRQEADSEQTVEMVQSRRSILNELRSLHDEQSKVNELETEIENLNSQSLNTTAIEEEIISKQAFIERNSQDPIIRLNKLLSVLDQLQSVTGLKFNSVQDTRLKLTLTGSDIELDLNLINLEDRKVILSPNLPEVTRVYLSKYLQENPALNLVELIENLKKISLSFKKLHKDIFYLGVQFPMKCNFDQGVTIDLIEFNRLEKYKVNINISLSEKQVIEFDTLPNVNARMVYGPSDLTEQEILSAMKNKLQNNNIIHSIESLNLVRD